MLAWQPRWQRQLLLTQATCVKKHAQARQAGRQPVMAASESSDSNSSLDCVATSEGAPPPVYSGGGTSETASHAAGSSSSSLLFQGASGRRMYPTHFKLRVLDSYRNDLDCRGNQRATARKFGIHRRQIQKWLQVESFLRASFINNNSPSMMDPLMSSVPSPFAPPPSSSSFLEEPAATALNLSIKADQHERLHELQTPSPSTSSTSGKRRSFTLQFKLDVLNAFYGNGACRGNQRATARHFGINRRQVQKWLCQELQLRGEAALGSSGDSESVAKRQRLGRWLWNVPHWTAASWSEEGVLPHPSPPQDTALCLVKVEKTSPHQESDSVPSAPPADSPKPKRHSYPLDFKLQALDAYHEDSSCRGNQRAVAKQFSIHRRQIQKWLKQEAQLRQKSALGREVRRDVTRRPAVLKPVQVVLAHQGPSWAEDSRMTTHCWS